MYIHGNHNFRTQSWICWIQIQPGWEVEKLMQHADRASWTSGANHVPKVATRVHGWYRRDGNGRGWLGVRAIGAMLSMTKSTLSRKVTFAVTVWKLLNMLNLQKRSCATVKLYKLTAFWERTMVDSVKLGSMDDFLASWRPAKPAKTASSHGRRRMAEARSKISTSMQVTWGVQCCSVVSCLHSAYWNQSSILLCMLCECLLVHFWFAFGEGWQGWKGRKGWKEQVHQTKYVCVYWSTQVSVRVSSWSGWSLDS